MKFKAVFVVLMLGFSSMAIGAVFPLGISIQSTPQGGGSVVCTIGGSQGNCPGGLNAGTTVRLNAHATQGWSFDGWGGHCASFPRTSACELVMTSPRVVIANFSQPTLTVATAGEVTGKVVSQQFTAGKIDCGTSCVLQLPKGQPILLTASTYQGVLDQWVNCPTPNGNQCNFELGPTTTITAKFRKPRLTVTKTGAGASAGVVTSSPPGINCGSNCSAGFDMRSYVSLEGAPGSGNIVIFSECRGACRIEADKTVTATFRPPELQVNLFGTGRGTVVSTPPNINCGATCKASFMSNQGVDLTATADSVSQFVGYRSPLSRTEPFSPTCATNPICHLVTTGDQSVVAEFARVLRLEVVVSGSGSVTSQGASPLINCSQNQKDGCLARIAQTGVPEITLKANLPAGVQFTGWTDDCAAAGTSLQCLVRMDKDHKVGAKFTP